MTTMFERPTDFRESFETGCAACADTAEQMTTAMHVANFILSLSFKLFQNQSGTVLDG
jgi:hypothetical protein